MVILSYEFYSLVLTGTSNEPPPLAPLGLSPIAPVPLARP